MSITFADVVHPALSFSEEIEAEALVLELIENPWLQRLRDISQTANTRLVYMFSEHSRFGHCLGVAYLANVLMKNLAPHYPEIEKYRKGVSAAAMLHDIGHLAPGSHAAFKTWFPGQKDSHEALTTRIINGSEELRSILTRYDADLPRLVCDILEHSPDLPPWTWEIISGGGWNVDRGNWCVVDSIMAGVNYGEYNIPALIESITITDKGHLALRENRLDAMMHFAVSRHAMYRQIYHHRTILSADMLNRALVQRARDIGLEGEFMDQAMSNALRANSADDLELDTIFAMRESWWRYHLLRWSQGRDSIIADLADRLLHRRLFKTVRVRDDDNRESLIAEAKTALKKANYEPAYYLHEVTTSDMHHEDHQQSMKLLMDDGRVKNLADADPLFNVMVTESKKANRAWLALPAEAKAILGRER